MIALWLTGKQADIIAEATSNFFADNKSDRFGDALIAKGISADFTHLVYEFFPKEEKVQHLQSFLNSFVEEYNLLSEINPEWPKEDTVLTLCAMGRELNEALISFKDEGGELFGKRIIRLIAYSMQCLVKLQVTRHTQSEQPLHSLFLGPT